MRTTPTRAPLVTTTAIARTAIAFIHPATERLIARAGAFRSSLAAAFACRSTNARTASRAIPKVIPAAIRAPRPRTSARGSTARSSARSAMMASTARASFPTTAFARLSCPRAALAIPAMPARAPIIACASVGAMATWGDAKPPRRWASPASSKSRAPKATPGAATTPFAAKENARLRRRADLARRSCRSAPRRRSAMTRRTPANRGRRTAKAAKRSSNARAGFATSSATAEPRFALGRSRGSPLLEFSKKKSRSPCRSRRGSFVALSKGGE